MWWVTNFISHDKNYVQTNNWLRISLLNRSWGCWGELSDTLAMYNQMRINDHWLYTQKMYHRGYSDNQALRARGIKNNLHKRRQIVHFITDNTCMHNQRPITFHKSLAIDSKRRLSIPWAPSKEMIIQDIRDHLNQKKMTKISYPNRIGYKVEWEHHTYVLMSDPHQRETIHILSIR